MEAIIIEVDKLFGISDSKDFSNRYVPCVHENPEDAISEWKYFETLNSVEKQFLDYKHTLEEIDEIENELKNMAKHKKFIICKT